VFDIAGSPADWVHRPRVDRLLLVGAMIEPRDFSAIRAGVYDLGIDRVGRDIPTLPPTNVVPVGPINRAIRAGAGDGNGGVVLLSAVNSIRKAVVGNHMVELRRWLVVLAGPGFSVIDRNRGPSVIAVDQTLRISGIDPQRMIVSVGRV